MDSAQLPDLDGLDREALKALLVQHQEQLLSLAASHENELRSLEAELESQRNILSEQSQELRSSSEQIEHLKLVIEKLRRRVFGVKSEKIVIQLEQLELHLEELESSQAESEAAVERVRPTAEPKTSRIFGQCVGKTRQAAGFSVAEAAVLAGMESSEWAAVEAGYVPNPDQLRPMADALGVGFDKFATWVALCRDAWEA